ncbi:hypothetical protein JA1_001575 [Spathaspora sp. JA1]|nr:hypothetical protein JA1_001575 [Spathaspora sp. JA1]
MSNIPQIPGYYYDHEKKKYFQIVNGSTVDSTKRYHNNSIQIENRRDKIAKKSNKSTPVNHTNIIRNPRLTEDLKENILGITSIGLPGCFAIDLDRIKSGEISLLSHYYKNDQIDILPTPKYIPELVPRGIVIGQLNRDLLVIQRITDTIIRDGNIFRLPSCISIQNITSGKVYNLPKSWQFRYGSLQDYFENNNLEINTEQVIHDITPGVTHSNFFHIITFAQMKGSIIKFNRCEELKFYDYTKDLLLFIKNQKVDGSMRKVLDELFGLNLIIFSSSKKHQSVMNEKSVEEMNKKLLQLRQSDISLQAKSTLETEINQFINQKMMKMMAVTEPKMEYNQNNTLNNQQRYSLSGCFDKDSIYLLSTGGLIFKITFTIESGSIKFHNIYHTSISCNRHQGQISIVENCIHVTMGETFYKIDSNLPLLGSHKDVRFHKKNLPGLRKLFSFRPDLALVVSIDQIYYLKGNKIDLIENYDHKNDPNQNFEIISNHLIYDQRNIFRLINLNRSENNSTSFSIIYNYEKCGYLKGFKLIKIIEMISSTPRLKIGLTFYNPNEKTTIFESYEI